MSEGILERYIPQAFPGGVLAVWKKEREVYFEYAGKACVLPAESDVKPSTIFDVASLTKPLLTGLISAYLHERGQLPLDVKVGDVFKESGSKLKEVTVEELLAHTSGLPAYLPLYKKVPFRLWGSQTAREVFLSSILNLDISRRGKRLYSDLGFILLGFIIEKVTGEDFRDLAKKILLKADVPQGNAFLGSAPNNDDCACTELSLIEGKVLRGITHDENARALGGLAGHAGLFASARGLIQLVKVWIHGYHGKDGLISSEVIAYFLGHDPPLAWDRPEGESSIYGRLPERLFAHAGYTGCAVLMDVEEQAAVLLLTNRVHPSRVNWKFHEARRKILTGAWDRWVRCEG